ncbi:hypothetical protein GLV92_02100, partial [Staphylococcus agnetis]|nr:hypothetical protein [Staphylococcus agnetis]
MFEPVVAVEFVDDEVVVELDVSDVEVVVVVDYCCEGVDSVGDCVVVVVSVDGQY